MSSVKEQATEVVKAIGAEAQAEGNTALVWIEAHPAIMGALLAGIVIGFFFGYLVGSHWG